MSGCGTGNGMKRIHLIKSGIGKCMLVWILGICVICMLPISCARATEEAQDETGSEVSEYSLNDFYFDTVISIRIYAGENGKELIDGCRSICDEI
jgi:hypothetical protein